MGWDENVNCQRLLWATWCLLFAVSAPHLSHFFYYYHKIFAQSSSDASRSGICIHLFGLLMIEIHLFFFIHFCVFNTLSFACLSLYILRTDVNFNDFAIETANRANSSTSSFQIYDIRLHSFLSVTNCDRIFC